MSKIFSHTFRVRWSELYAKTGCPVHLPMEEIDKFRLENPRVFPFERFPKITPAEGSFTMQRQVEWMAMGA